MRIIGPRAACPSGSAGQPGRGRVQPAAGRRPQWPEPPLRAVGSIDALIALQGRRSRGPVVASAATRVGLLDGILSGCLDLAMLLRLKTAAAGLKDLSGDPRVDQVLN